jgi:hypothetical protein
VAWALSFCQIVPEAAWIDQLLLTLAPPALKEQSTGQKEEELHMSCDAVLDLTQALKVSISIWHPSL